MAIKLGIEIIKFLNAARNLVKNNAMSKEGILRFAKQQFGEVPGYLRVQIDKLFKSKPIKTEKKGEVVPIKKKEGIETLSESEKYDQSLFEQKAINFLKRNVKKEKKELEKVTELEKLSSELLEEAKNRKIVKKRTDDIKKGDIETLSEADQDIADIQKSIDDLDAAEAEADAFSALDKRTRDIAKGDPTGETSDLMKGLEDKMTGIKKAADEMKDIANKSIKNPYRPGGPLDPKIGIVRAAVREILHNNLKAGKINIPDAAEKEAIEKYMANKDPIDIFRKTYGENALEVMDAWSDDLLQIDQAGGSLNDLNKFLQDKKLFEFTPKKTYGYDESIVSADKILKQAEQDAKNKKILEDFDIDPDREPNADGGIIGNLRLNRTGFDDGSKDPKISRRKFMKIIGGLSAVPIAGKYFKLGSAVSSKVAPAVAPVVKEVPGYLGALIEVIRSKGTEAVTKLGNKITEYKGVVVEEQPGRIEVYKVGDSKKNSHEIIEGIEEVKDEGLETQKIVQGDDEYYGQTTKEGEKKFKEIASEINTMVEDMDQASPYVRFDRTLGKEKMADGGLINILKL